MGPWLKCGDQHQPDLKVFKPEAVLKIRGELINVVASADFPALLVCGDPGPSNFSNLIRYFHQLESDIKGVNCQIIHIKLAA